MPNVALKARHVIPECAEENPLREAKRVVAPTDSEAEQAVLLWKS